MEVEVDSMGRRTRSKSGVRTGGIAAGAGGAMAIGGGKTTTASATGGGSHHRRDDFRALAIGLSRAGRRPRSREGGW